ncbi:hypothetical protein BJX70DRAFT_342821 [Aspergillus crustosus]
MEFQVKHKGRERLKSVIDGTGLYDRRTNNRSNDKQSNKRLSTSRPPASGNLFQIFPFVSFAVVSSFANKLRGPKATRKRVVYQRPPMRPAVPRPGVYCAGDIKSNLRFGPGHAMSSHCRAIRQFWGVRSGSSDRNMQRRGRMMKQTFNFHPIYAPTRQTGKRPSCPSSKRSKCRQDNHQGRRNENIARGGVSERVGQ